MKKWTRKNHDLSSDLDEIICKLDETKDAIADAAYDVKSSAENAFHHSVDRVKNKSLDARESLVSYIQEKPLKSLGMAFLAGIIIKQLFRK